MSWFELLDRRGRLQYFYSLPLWRGKIYPSHLKGLISLDSPVWQVGLCPWGNSRVTRDRTSSPPESTRKTLSRTARTYASCPVCYINDTRTAAPEDGSTGGQQRWRWGTIGFRVDVNTSRHVDFRVTRYRRFDHRRHRSSESDVRDDQMPPRDPEDAPSGTQTPGLDILYFRHFVILNSRRMM